MPDEMRDVLERVKRWAEHAGRLDHEDAIIAAYGVPEGGRKQRHAMFAEDARALLAHIEVLEGALREIAVLKERPFTGFPADWLEQTKACADCQRYTGHPIQRGICNTHRQPLWARERHDQHETAILGSRAWRIANDALNALDALHGRPSIQPEEEKG